MIRTLILSTLLAVACCAQLLLAQPVNLRKAVMLVSPSIPMPMRETAPRMLQEEIAKRTSVTIRQSEAWPGSGGVAIALALTTDAALYGISLPARTTTGSAEQKPEGFRVLTSQQNGQTTVWVIGADARGVLFGAGWLLRHLQMDATQLQLPEATDVAIAPAYPIRGHQLGYRTTANSYDAWTVAQFEQYIRDLAIFGSNSVEGIPFHEDETPSVHFKIPAAQMRIKMSEICRQYDMDYWVWTPVTFELHDAAKRKAELELHESFYRECPRLDHIFVPGGDPGDNHPRDVMPFLKELHDRLVRYHPKAKVWLSLQGFSVEQVDYFYRYLEQQKPAWFAGVVSGPGSPPMAETRNRLPKQYGHRQYPDITHTVRCEFPVERWDQAYALTLGREAANPRPFASARIQGTFGPFTDGFLAYSDGCHDDVNKVIWSMRAVEPTKDVNEILTEYSRFFFSPSVAGQAAAGIAALEQNWKGPLAENGGVEATYQFWKSLEAGQPKLAGNWRWQLCLLRANYDVYTRRRQQYEQGLERDANTVLAGATESTIDASVAKALEVVNRADKAPVSPDIRAKVETLCAALYSSIGLQTSVPKYKAKGYERGALLDFVDYPLNNRWWLADECEKLKKLPSKTAQLERIHVLAGWENPGPGSYYDDVSNVSKGPRVTTVSDDATDVAWWDNGSSRARLSSQLFQRAPALTYTNLEPGARYVIRVAGYGEALLRVDGKRLEPVLYNREAETFKEWIVPLSLTMDGQLSVTFDEPEESHLNWRKQSRISDVWLLKQ